MGLAVDCVIDDRLQELDQGEWTNLPRTTYEEPEIKREMMRLGSDFAPPGGESINDVRRRMREYLESLVPAPGLDRPELIWAFTHAVAIKSLVGDIEGWSHEHTYKTGIDNVSITRLGRFNGAWRLVFLDQQTTTLAA
jgi:broad specificity phosphatase PhoE